MKKYASVCSGSEAAGVGAVAAGYTPIWGNEIDPEIAAVAKANGFPLIVKDVCAVDFSELPVPDWFHMSPVCTRASLANKKRGESPIDLAIAAACSRAIRTLRPAWISLENVWAYRTFDSFKNICATLAEQGYQTEFWHINSANIGVPQTRKRLILCASLHTRPLPPPCDTL